MLVAIRLAYRPERIGYFGVSSVTAMSANAIYFYWRDLADN
jgi:hypothetical protein